MPTTKNFDKNNSAKMKQGKKKTNDVASTSEMDASTAMNTKPAKRRPGRDSDMATDQLAEAHSESSPTAQFASESTEAHGTGYSDRVQVVDVEPMDQTQHSSESGSSSDSASNSSDSTGFSNDHSKEKVEIRFLGSELIRARFPKPFDVAESIATDWVTDGNFEGLPLGHPLAQVLAQQGLKKAKGLEKKILTSPVTEKIAMQALTAAFKGQQMVNDLKSQIQTTRAKIFKKDRK